MLCLSSFELYSRWVPLFLVTRFMEEVSYVFPFTFFHCRSFSPCINIGGRYHFSFCHRCYKIFTLFFQQKNAGLSTLPDNPETPDFEPFLPVPRLEFEISRIIPKFAISCRFNFLTTKFQIFCVV